MNVLIVGATSAIAQAVSKQLLSNYNVDLNFIIVGRNNEHLRAISDDLMVRGAKAVTCIYQDLSQASEMAMMIEQCWTSYGYLDIALLAHGSLPEQSDIQDNWDAVANAYNVNTLSYLAIMTALAPRFEKQRHGSLAIISSVAGDRGRKSNYIYGSAKSAVSLFAQGLRNRLFTSNIQVLIIKPGFVDTPMTASIEKNGPLWSSSEIVAKDIVTAIKKRKDVIYTPRFWQLIMLIIRSIPEAVFKRLSI